MQFDLLVQVNLTTESVNMEYINGWRRRTFSWASDLFFKCASLVASKGNALRKRKYIIVIVAVDALKQSRSSAVQSEPED